MKLAYAPIGTYERLIGKIVVFSNHETSSYAGYYSSFDVRNNSFRTLNVEKNRNGHWLPTPERLRSPALEIPVGATGMIVDMYVEGEEFIVLINEDIVRISARFVEPLVPFVVNSAE